ncbi:hypothetical protein BJ508DRAFT_183151 [Ascobolus immersus RN42]|uniref:SCD domain-containing protein n=1 Tax=Ascobolus immersus RN42 TaxID=1160509 RepID=A0A3N4HRT1_ASCIM|nr:hypothetical protein BJ508DRAFT_183151 [Ascobolus immersus RN42]
MPDSEPPPDASPTPTPSNPDPPTSTRRSTRARRAPNLPYTQSQTPQPTSNRRKRTRAESEVASDPEAAADEVDLSESSSSDDGDETPDEEEIKAKRKANKGKRAARGSGKRAPKKPRTGDGPKPRAKKTTGPKQKARTMSPEEQIEDDGSAVLFDEIMGAKNIDTVANAWLEKYTTDQSEAIKDMINFIIKACGCKTFVSQYDAQDQDSAAETLTNIQEQYARSSIQDYALVSKRPEVRKFRKQVMAFFASLVAHIEAKNLLFGEDTVLENIQNWVAALSSSTCRPFRHTATFVCLNIIEALCDIAGDVMKLNLATQRQLEVEEEKGRKNQGRIAQLKKKVEEGEGKSDAFEKLIKDIFDTVWVHRYRDVEPKIRADCIRKLGDWISSSPAIFFDGAFLRYLGWVLSDLSGNCRLETIKALQKIYENKDCTGGLRSFTERFRSRLVEMATLDSDVNVRAAAVELLDVIREIGYLEPSDVEEVGKMLFDSEPKVRKAVMGFFVKTVEDEYDSKVEDLGGADALEQFDTEDDSKGVKLSWLRLKCLVEVLGQGEADGNEDEGESQGVAEKTGDTGVKLGGWDSRISLAGEVLWEGFEEVQEWEEIAKYLLFDHSNPQSDDEESEDIEEKLRRICALTAKEESILLQILNASIRASIEAGSENPAHSVKKSHKKKDAKAVEEHAEQVSRTLTNYLPQLLKKFGAVPDALSTVLKLFQVMKLDVYQILRQETAYSNLVDEIGRQFLAHADESVLKETSMVLLHSNSFDDLKDVTGRKIESLYEDCVVRLMENVKGRNPTTTKFSDAALTDLINSVRRLDYLSTLASSTEVLESPPPGVSEKNKTPLQIIAGLLARAHSTDELEEELMVRTLKVVVWYFMWKIKTLAGTPPSEIADTDIDDLQDNRSEILTSISKTIESRRHRDLLLHPVTTASIHAFLDIHIHFATLRRTFDPQIAALNDDDDLSPISRLPTLAPPISESYQRVIHELFTKLEKRLATALGKNLPPNPPIPFTSPREESPEPDSSDDEEGQPPQAKKSFDHHVEWDRHHTLLLTRENALCELTGKLVLACLSGTLLPPRWRERLEFNKHLLGAGFRGIVDHLDQKRMAELREKKEQAKSRGRKKKEDGEHKSTEMVESDDEEPDVDELDRELEEMEKEIEEENEEDRQEEEEKGEEDKENEEDKAEKEGEKQDGEGDVEMEDA